jgi:hypothetical protein
VRRRQGAGGAGRLQIEIEVIDLRPHIGGDDLADGSGVLPR